MIRTLIADDEPLAREGVKVRLSQEPDIEIVAEAADGLAAVETIKRLTPDLAFLDVQMPGLDGFEVLDQVAPVHLPIIVFVTAYDQYELKAFEANALDYLMKPFTRDRFEQALKRARRELEIDEERASLVRLLESQQTSPAARAIRRFTVPERNRYLLIKDDEIDWIESAANYVKLHALGRAFMMRMTMTEMERTLDATRFARIHRSTFVNIDRIKEITPEWHGDFDVVLHSGQTLRLSRSYRDRLLR